MKNIELKYGCNPNQKPASVYMEDGSELPFEVLNGRFRTISVCRRCQLSAFAPASLVQCTLDCCPAPTPIVCPSTAYATELDCVYLSAIRAITRSYFASSVIFLFSVTTCSRHDLSILMSLCFCSKVIPNTCFVSTSGALKSDLTLRIR